MKRRQFLYHGALLSTVVMTACASQNSLQLLVTHTDSGEYITLRRSQKLVIELPKNKSENINWKLVEAMGDVMYTPVKQEVQLVTNPVSMVRYVFTPKQIGLGRIRITENRLEDDQATPLQEFTLTVSVVQ